MELALSREDAAFRDEVRAFIAQNYPAEMRVPNPETDLNKEQMLLWHRILHKKGWIAPLWPKEYGGAGWGSSPRFFFRTGDFARRNAAAAGVQRHHGRPGDLHVRQQCAEAEIPAANPLR